MIERTKLQEDILKIDDGLAKIQVDLLDADVANWSTSVEISYALKHVREARLAMALMMHPSDRTVAHEVVSS